MNMAKKIRLTLNDREYRIVINAINDMRNRLIQEGRYTDAVDELLIKLQALDCLVSNTIIFVTER